VLDDSRWNVLRVTTLDEVLDERQSVVATDEQIRLCVSEVVVEMICNTGCENVVKQPLYPFQREPAWSSPSIQPNEQFVSDVLRGPSVWSQLAGRNTVFIEQIIYK
jgi:hypothetical protein